MPVKKKSKMNPKNNEEYIILKLDRVEAELYFLKEMIIRNGNQIVDLKEKILLRDL